jgi:CRISPR-associated protein Csd1
MTILQALDRYYDRMAARGEAEAPGYSREKISFAIVLSGAGEPVDCIDLREATGKRLVPRLLEVPAAVKRTVGISPNRLWDKSAYVLGRTAGKGRRIADEHAAFKALHSELLTGTSDVGLTALGRFLAVWTPERFDEGPFSANMLDSNIVFRLDGDPCYLHERQASRKLVSAPVSAAESSERTICLVTGRRAPAQRLHASIKGVEGAQSSGAALVSFNLDAFASYNKEQGDNAPVSVDAAFRYGASLNRMLDRASRNRLPRPIGDATVIFWADAAGASEAAAAAAEDVFSALINPSAGEADPEKLGDDASEAAKARDFMNQVAAGRPLRNADQRLTDGVRFHVLGLSPNAARLSVRFWLDGSFELFARRLSEHYADLAIEPAPWRASLPAVNRLLVKTTALQEKFDNIPPLLAGEMMRAVLTGGPYPRTLLSAAIMRLRAGDEPTGWHAAVIRAVLVRNQRRKRISADIPGRGETPVSLDREHPNIGYQLGRLFAVYEIAQRSALGRGVKSTIRDKYFGAASATPASIFPVIISNGQNHLSKVRKDKPGWAHVLERELEEVVGRITPARPFSLPRSMPLEDQGEFAIGYYHQRAARLGGSQADQFADEDSEEGEDNA